MGTYGPIPHKTRPGIQTAKKPRLRRTIVSERRAMAIVIAASASPSDQLPRRPGQLTPAQRCNRKRNFQTRKKPPAEARGSFCFVSLLTTSGGRTDYTARLLDELAVRQPRRW